MKVWHILLATAITVFLTLTIQFWIKFLMIAGVCIVILSVLILLAIVICFIDKVFFNG